jgi:hypothetical protein
MGAAAGEACDSAPWPTDTIVGVSASGAVEAEAALHSMPYKGQLVRALLIGNSEIDTGLSPLGTMGRETATPMPVLGDEVCKLVEKRFIHLGFGNFLKSRIEPDLPP